MSSNDTPKRDESSETRAATLPMVSPESEQTNALPLPREQKPASVDVTFMVSTLIMAASLVMVLWNLQDSSLKNANTGSRYATIESLVDFGTFTIDKSRYRRTIDKVKVGENFLSSKPPTLPTAAAGSYWVYQKLTGKTIKRHEGPVVWFVSLCTGWLFHLIFLVYFYRLCRLLLKRQLALIAAIATASFSYLGVAYATSINNHSIAASMAVVGLYYVFRIRSEADVKLRHWYLAGLVFGFLPAVDLPSALFAPLVIAYLWTHNWRRTLYMFVPMLLPGALTHFTLSYVTTGSLIPAYFNDELKNFEGNYFRGKQSGIDALREPKHIYTFNALLGHHGLFSMTPVFFFGAWEMARSLRNRVRFPETLLVVSTLLLTVIVYVLRTRNYGGWCVGMRHLVPMMPLLLLYFALWLDRVRLRKPLWGLVLAAFSVGAFHVQDGLTSPFQYSVWHNWLEDKPNRGRVGKRMNVPKQKKTKTKKGRTKKPKKKDPS